MKEEDGEVGNEEACGARKGPLQGEKPGVQEYLAYKKMPTPLVPS